MFKKIGSLAVLGFAVANLTGCWNLPVDPFPTDPTDPPGDTVIVDPKPPCDTTWRDPGFPPNDTIWHDPGFPPDSGFHDPGFPPPPPPRDSNWVWDDSVHVGDHGGRGRR